MVEMLVNCEENIPTITMLTFICHANSQQKQITPQLHAVFTIDYSYLLHLNYFFFMGRLTAPEIVLQSQGYPAKDQVTYFLIDKTAIPIKLHSM